MRSSPGLSFALLFALFLYSNCFLGIRDQSVEHSWLCDHLPIPVGGGWGKHRIRAITAAVSINGDVLQLVEDASREDLEAGVAEVALCHIRTRRGFWALTRERTRCWVEGEPATAALTDEQMKVVRAELTGMSAKYPSLYAVAANRIPAGDIDETKILWLGYVHNIISLALVGALACSFGWVRDLTPRARRRAALARGECFKCGYDIRGLASPRCPECGDALDRV